MRQATNLVPGERVWIKEDGVNTQYEIAGFNIHGSGTMTVVRMDIHSNSIFGANTNYKNSTLDSFMNSFEAKYSIPHRMLMREADIIVATGNSDASQYETLKRRVFALSYTEVGFGNNYYVAENAALPQYSLNAQRIKKLNNNAAYWWLRSWYSSSFARRVYTDGTADYDSPSYTNGVVPAHVLKSDIWVSDEADGGAYVIYYGYDHRIDFDAKMNEMEDMPKAARAEIDHNGLATIYLCNNYNDASPGWEIALNGIEHVFENTTKTALKWAVGIRILIDREYDEDLYCHEPIVIIRR